MKRPLLIAGAGMALAFWLVMPAQSTRPAGGTKQTTVSVPARQNEKAVQRTTTSRIQPTAVTAAPVKPSPPPVTRSSASANYQINWLSVNSANGPAASANYQTNVTIGQVATGEPSSANFQAEIGYWYGANGGSGGCDCPYQSDFDADGFPTSIDLAALIDILFAGQPNIQDPDCPNVRADFDCDGFPTSIDLAGLIDYLFVGAHGPCDPCAP